MRVDAALAVRHQLDQGPRAAPGREQFHPIAVFQFGNGDTGFVEGPVEIIREFTVAETFLEFEKDNPSSL